MDEYAAANAAPCVATVGTFDGFHRGHASIFERLAAHADAAGLPASAITFHPHPRVVVTPNDPPPLLTTPEEKTDILRDHFDGSLVFLNFDDKMRRMTAEQFINDILLDRFHIKALVVGYNHSFGHQRSGTADQLADLGLKAGFKVEVVSPVTYQDMPISSTRIRRVIKGGEWEDALQMLGHPYPIRGRVVKGIGQGRRLGWPTINLAWSERKLLPPAGVYACSALVDRVDYRGMMFIGVNMLNPQHVVSVEAHLFDFDRDLYGADVALYPSHFVRPNVRFGSPEELSRQIAHDKETVLKLIL
ncbi:MAG: bifunctional riboflavin kinase/FAD synthetase [candidate division Zixibacteria bacterium]|nr:bifunctional riboflavin kinase/FAD synthetase [candidate division Zixibacteria bacterium]